MENHRSRNCTMSFSNYNYLFSQPLDNRVASNDQRVFHLTC